MCGDIGIVRRMSITVLFCPLNFIYTTFKECNLQQATNKKLIRLKNVDLASVIFKTTIYITNYLLVNYTNLNY